MAGKSNRGKNRKGLQQSATNSSELAVSSDAPLHDSSSASQANGDKSLSESIDTKSEMKEQDNTSEQHPKQGGVNSIQFFCPLSISYFYQYLHLKLKKYIGENFLAVNF